MNDANSVRPSPNEIKLLQNTKDLNKLTLKEGRLVKKRFWNKTDAPTTDLENRISTILQGLREQPKDQAKVLQNLSTIQSLPKQIQNACKTAKKVLYGTDDTVAGLKEEKLALKKAAEELQAPYDQHSADRLRTAIGFLENVKSTNPTVKAKVEKLKALIRGQIEDLKANETNRFTAFQQRANTLLDELKETHQLARKIAKAQFTLQLTGVPKAGKGATGTLLIFDFGGKLLGAYKPHSSMVRMGAKVGNFFKSMTLPLFGGIGQLSHLSRGKEAQSKAEVAVYEMDRAFSIHSVPPAARMMIGKKEGTFQMNTKTYAKAQSGAESQPEMKEAKEVLGQLEKDSYTEEERKVFGRFALLDMLSGNMDAHEENYFIETDKDKIKTIVAIDKANSLPEKVARPGARLARNQYKWKNLPIANKPFPEETLALMKSLSREKVEEYIIEIEKKPGYKDFFTPSMKEQLVARAQAMRLAAISKNELTPKAMAEALQNPLKADIISVELS